MKRWILSMVAVAAFAASANAGGLNMSWDACGAAGVVNKNFACDVNTGADQFVLSVVPPTNLTAYTGADVNVDILMGSASLPAWWQFTNAGSCRIASLSANIGPATLGTCADPYGGLGFAGIAAYRTFTTINPTPAPNRSRIVLSAALFFPTALSSTQEYFIANVVINHANTVGGSACAGCATPACILFSECFLRQSVGVGDHFVNNTAVRNHVTWQGGAVSGGCPAATPAENRTWGSIKSMYR